MNAEVTDIAIFPNLDVRKVLVTPKLAKELLLKNKTNRPLDPRVVAMYAEDIASARWQFNGETIKVNENGDLTDGQHRLHAVIKAGMAIQVLIVYGLKPETFQTIDTGKKRTGSQILGLAGHKNATALASSARWCVILDSGINNSTSVSSKTILECIEKHPLLHHFASRHTEKGVRSYMPAACGAVMTLGAEKYGLQPVDAFLTEFASGENLKRGDPPYELRERLIQNSARVAKLTTETIVAITIKAVRSYMVQKPLGVLRWSSNEEWPKI